MIPIVRRLSRNRWMAAVCAAVAGSLLVPQVASASCGSESCPLALPERQFEGSRFSIDASVQFIDQDRVRVGTRRAAVGELPSPEDEVRTRNRIVTLLGRVGLSDSWALSVSLPVVNRLHQHITNEADPPAWREWDFTGVGDLSFLGHWTPIGAGAGASTSFTLQAGLKLPTGKRHVPPSDGEEPEPPARPGTGSTDGLLGIHLMRALQVRTPGGSEAMMPLFAGLFFRAPGRGTENYQVGRQLEASFGGNYPLGRYVDVLAQVNARFRGKDNVGSTDALRDNTGGRVVYASPGVRVRPGAGFAAYAYVQLPLYQRVNRIQIVAPYNVFLGLVRGF